MIKEKTYAQTSYFVDVQLQIQLCTNVFSFVYNFNKYKIVIKNLFLDFSEFFANNFEGNLKTSNLFLDFSEFFANNFEENLKTSNLF